MQLVIGSKNLSSWSLRAWLVLRVAGLPFEEVVVPLARADTRQRLAEASPSGRVPVLKDGPVTIWDSLAIAEYAAELVPGLWPEDRAARALARAYAAEMHAGFADLRTFLPFDASARFEPPGKLLRGVARDVGRIQELWRTALERRAPGGFLFGRFSIADAMFAPVASRFVTYAIPLDPACARYVTTVMEHPAMRQWLAEAAAEVAASAEREPAPGMAQPAVAGPASAPARPPARPALPPRPAPFDARRVTRPTPGPAPATAAPAAPAIATPPATAPAPSAAVPARASEPVPLPPDLTYLDGPAPPPPAEPRATPRLPMRPADAGFTRRELPPAVPAPRRAASPRPGGPGEPPAQGELAVEPAALPDVAGAERRGAPPDAVDRPAGERARSADEAEGATMPAASDAAAPGIAEPARAAPPGAAPGAGPTAERPVNRFAAALSAGRLAWQRRQEEVAAANPSASQEPPPRPGPRGGGIKPIGSGIHRRR